MVEAVELCCSVYEVGDDLMPGHCASREGGVEGGEAARIILLGELCEEDFEEVRE